MPSPAHRKLKNKFLALPVRAVPGPAKPRPDLPDHAMPDRDASRLPRLVYLGKRKLKSKSIAVVHRARRKC